MAGRRTAKQIAASRRNLVKARAKRRRKVIKRVAIASVGAGLAYGSYKGSTRNYDVRKVYSQNSTGRLIKRSHSKGIGGSFGVKVGKNRYGVFYRSKRLR